MALFSRLKLKVQFALSKKVIISEMQSALPIYYWRGGGGERHGLLEAACNDLPKLDQREEWVSRKSFGDDVEFEVCFWKRIPFLEKGIYFDEYDVICSSGKVIMN